MESDDADDDADADASGDHVDRAGIANTDKINLPTW